MKEIYWWGYLHSNGKIQIKRWFGDHRDYTEDCDNNEFVISVVKPFVAPTFEDAEKIIRERLNL